MNYQVLYGALAHRNQRDNEIDHELIMSGRNLRQPTDEELQEERRQQYLDRLDRLDQLTDHVEIAYAAIQLVIAAAEVSPEHLQLAFERVAQKGFKRKVVEAAVALLEYDAKFPTCPDARRERRVVWQALTQ